MDILNQKLFGLDFPNPVGLGAGYDKSGQFLDNLQDKNLGFIELGSVTLNPYNGNPKPWELKLSEDKSLLVNYGLKNSGVIQFIKNIQKSNNSLILGISVAKTNSPETAYIEKGILDYYQCLKKLKEEDIGDFYTINISCPNSFGGEPFTSASKLKRLLKKIKTLRVDKPIFVKMPINTSFEEFDELLQVIIKYDISGVVIGNLNKNREGLQAKIPNNIKGGIGGKHTWKLSNELIARTYKKYKNKLIIQGAGGIFSAEDAYEKIKHGSSLVQLVTSTRYKGLSVFEEINKGLIELLKKDNLNNVSNAVGLYHR